LVKGELTAYLHDSVGAFDLNRVRPIPWCISAHSRAAIGAAAGGAAGRGGRLIFTVRGVGEWHR